MTNVAIIGAPGYAGVELTRLVLGHPHLRLVRATSNSEAGKPIGAIYPALAPFTDLTYAAHDVDDIAAHADVAFLAVPHTASLDLAPPLLERGLVVVDASADFRLTDPEVYERWYGVAHTAPNLLAQAVYGLPEIDRSGLAGARLVACPGCYPTATLLAAVPAIEAGVVDPARIVVDAKSGVSGAGRSPGAGTHFSTVNESLQPYKVGTHRHIPEMEQVLSSASGKAVRVVFTPHLVPMTRGMLSTVYLDLAADVSTAEVVEMYRARFAGEPFITVLDAGLMPSTSGVRGSNRAHIGIAVDPCGMLVVACAIDNLVKGTSGQAIQCANIALGLEETDGLMMPVPVI